MMFQTQDKDRRAVGYWLLFMTAIVLLMVMVGGATRLTESGLSMTDWRPVTGVLPPLSDSAWQEEFAKYQQSPEYRIRNKGMSLGDFKGIFYWEWGHRLLGRLIGVFFFVPMVWFWVKGRIPQGYKPRLVTLFILGGSQGLLGWYMVMSGLVDEPAVSHYRLTAHLMLALFIMAMLFWTALSLLNPNPVSGSSLVSGTRKALKILTHSAMLVLVLQLVMGALVAGLKAGLIFNTWPMMGEGFIPDGLTALSPFWRNFIDNAITVQFDHRVGAYVLTAMVLAIVWQARRAPLAVRRAVTYVFITIVIQMILGVITLVHSVPVFWGTAHQVGGALVLLAMINLMHKQRRGEAQ